ncbi:MAG TPA: hypothetical protein VGO57_06785 [Verrucomicrobiae bacterium]|jgi:hypothetical protein
MRALEILLNGKRLCVAAPGGDGVVISNVVLCSPLEKSGVGSVHFRVGGVCVEQHLEWVRQSLALGDTVEIRIVETTQPDSPTSIEPVKTGLEHVK